MVSSEQQPLPHSTHGLTGHTLAKYPTKRLPGDKTAFFLQRFLTFPGTSEQEKERIRTSLFFFLRLESEHIGRNNVYIKAFTCAHSLKLSTMHKSFTVYIETFEMTATNNSAPN